MFQKVLVAGVIGLCWLGHAHADSTPTVEGLQPVESPAAGPLKEGADFIPGQEVVDPSSGKRVKVWTTRGPVPVSQPPEPFATKPLPEGVGVVIDGRPDHFHSPYDRR